MKTNFKKTKKHILDFAIKKDACSGQSLRVENSEDFETLIQVVNDNINWVSQYQLFNQVNIKEYFPEDLIQKYELNMGVDNIGFKNSGNRNSGDSNSGYRNSGTCNSAHSNTRYSYSDDSNSVLRNCDHSNSIEINCNVIKTIFVQSEIRQ